MFSVLETKSSLYSQETTVPSLKTGAHSPSQYTRMVFYSAEVKGNFVG
jgi:hypothetical protein